MSTNRAGTNGSATVTYDDTFFSPPKNGKAPTIVPVRVKVVKAVPRPVKIAIPPSSSSPLAPKKRKSSPLEEQTPDSPLSPVSDLPPSSPPPRQVKKLRVEKKVKPRRRASSSRLSSSQPTLAPSPDPIYRSVSSNATSDHHDQQSATLHRRWATDKDGRLDVNHLSSAKVVEGLLKSYKQYFRNPNDPNDLTFEPKSLPTVELEYPNSHSVEQYLLLVPKDKDHYNPIMDLESSLYTMVEFYMTPEQRIPFGPIPSDAFSDEDEDDDLPPFSPPPNSRASASSTLSSSSTLTEASAGPGKKPPPAQPSLPPRPELLRTLQRSIRQQDGPTFLHTMKEINTLLRALKNPDPLLGDPLVRAVESWTDNGGLPKKVLLRIYEECYQRCVGPNVPKLKKYDAFSSEVYGELMPSLAYEIIQRTNLKPNSLFVDLGSGVGNIVAQASMQTGCKAYGIELLAAPAAVAREMVKQTEVRCRMWGVRTGVMEVEEGDMLKSARVDQLIPKADVVLVDNKVFKESLNEALRPKFLDLKEGAIVVSLASFGQVNARVTERNLDDMLSILDVTEHPYTSGSVSWGNNGGTYFIHRVDRAGYNQCRARFEESRRKVSRTRNG